MNNEVDMLYTERLVLREIQEEDTRWIVSWRSNPEVYQYFFSPNPITANEHKNWYLNYYLKDKNRIDFMALEKNGTRIGVFGVKHYMEHIQCGEISYLLDKSAQGKGYAQEVVKRLMLFAKEDWRCKEAILNIHEKNVPSLAVAVIFGGERKCQRGEFLTYSISLM